MAGRAFKSSAMRAFVEETFDYLVGAQRVVGCTNESNQGSPLPLSTSTGIPLPTTQQPTVAGLP